MRTKAKGDSTHLYGVRLTPICRRLGGSISLRSGAARDCVGRAWQGPVTIGVTSPHPSGFRH